MSSPKPQALVLVDGHCLLCQAWVKFLLPRDRRARMIFAPLQSEYAARALRDAGIDPSSVPLVGANGSRADGSPPQTMGSVEGGTRDGLEDGPGTVLLLEHGRLHERSGAAIRIVSMLGFPWSLLRVCLLIPPPIRNATYDFVAKRRYRWFGRSETCMVPPVDLDRRVREPDVPRRTGPGA